MRSAEKKTTSFLILANTLVADKLMEQCTVIYPQDHRSLVILKADLFKKLSFPIDLHIKKVCTNIHRYFPQLSRITLEVYKAIMLFYFEFGNTYFQKKSMSGNPPQILVILLQLTLDCQLSDHLS